MPHDYIKTLNDRCIPISSSAESPDEILGELVEYFLKLAASKKSPYCLLPTREMTDRFNINAILKKMILTPSSSPPEIFLIVEMMTKENKLDCFEENRPSWRSQAEHGWFREKHSNRCWYLKTKIMLRDNHLGTFNKISVLFDGASKPVDIPQVKRDMSAVSSILRSLVIS